RQRARDAGVEVVQVDAPEALHRRVNSAVDLVLGADVRSDGQRLAVQRRRDLLGGTSVAIDHDDRSALRRQQPGGGGADPAPGAGDQCDLVGDAHASSTHSTLKRGPASSIRLIIASSGGGGVVTASGARSNTSRNQPSIPAGE